MRNMVFTDIPGLPPIPALDLFSSFMDPLMYKWMSRHYFACQNADVVLINTYYDLEKPVLDALRNEVIAAPDAQVFSPTDDLMCGGHILVSDCFVC